MASVKSRALTAAEYEAAALEYLHSLPLEHFMESVDQSTQRKITLESFDLLHTCRPDVRAFSELLVQYTVPGKQRPGQVVPDNMVVLSDEPIEAQTCFNVPLQPEGPFWVLEYVSPSNPRKDYEDNFVKYERQLRVPYYLVFHPEVQHLAVFRHTGKKYRQLRPNKHGRYAIPELDLEMALHDSWVRFWYQGELLPLPADLQRDLDEARRRADEEKRRADEEKRRADEEALRAQEQSQRADELTRRLQEEQESRRALERELARLRGQARPPRRNNGPRPDR